MSAWDQLSTFPCTCNPRESTILYAHESGIRGSVKDPLPATGPGFPLGPCPHRTYVHMNCGQLQVSRFKVQSVCPRGMCALNNLCAFYIYVYCTYVLNVHSVAFTVRWDREKYFTLPTIGNTE